VSWTLVTFWAVIEGYVAFHMATNKDDLSEQDIIVTLEFAVGHVMAAFPFPLLHPGIGKSLQGE